jgi:hypothetical protein
MAAKQLFRLLPFLFILNASAAVRIVHFIPPLNVAAGDRGPKLADGKLALDLNSDGISELQILGSAGGLTTFFDAPTRIITTNTVGAVPFGTLIGSNLPPELIAFKWDAGQLVPTNSELRQFGGQQKAILSTMMAPRPPGTPPIQIATGGSVSQPTTSAGNMVGKEGVIGVEFIFNGQVHYGYVQFDFRGALGTGGKIFALAYETEPGKSITAVRIGGTP